MTTMFPPLDFGEFSMVKTNSVCIFDICAPVSFENGSKIICNEAKIIYIPSKDESEIVNLKGQKNIECDDSDDNNDNKLQVGTRSLFVNTPEKKPSLRHAAQLNSQEQYNQYVNYSNKESSKVAFRDLLAFDHEAMNRSSIIVNNVEPIEDIMKRFNTDSMSLGSVSKEAHETLASAMNKIGGRSNTGEGEEDSKTLYFKDIRSAIKQVALGRFGVTINYSANADQIQLKIAQIICNGLHNYSNIFDSDYLQLRLTSIIGNKDEKEFTMTHMVHVNDFFIEISKQKDACDDNDNFNVMSNDSQLSQSVSNIFDDYDDVRELKVSQSDYLIQK